MVGRGHRQIGAPDFAARHAQAVERLGRCDLVHQMKVHVEECWPSRVLSHYVGGPDFFDHGSGGHGAFLC